MPAIINNIFQQGLTINPGLKAQIQAQIATYLAKNNIAPGGAPFNIPGLKYNGVTYNARIQVTGLAGTVYQLDLYDLS